MSKRYPQILMAITAFLLIASITACTVESVFSLDDLDSIITEEETRVYAYTSGDQMAYEIYEETITVYDSTTTSLGTIEDGTITNDLGTVFDITIDDETLTISNDLYDPLVYTRVQE